MPQRCVLGELLGPDRPCGKRCGLHRKPFAVRKHVVTVPGLPSPIRSPNHALPRHYLSVGPAFPYKPCKTSNCVDFTWSAQVIRAGVWRPVVRLMSGRRCRFEIPSRCILARGRFCEHRAGAPGFGWPQKRLNIVRTYCRGNLREASRVPELPGLGL